VVVIESPQNHRRNGLLFAVLFGGETSTMIGTAVIVGVVEFDVNCDVDVEFVVNCDDGGRLSTW
jgi:hypothetical protein